MGGDNLRVYKWKENLIMKLSKLTKISKKVLAVVLALAMTFVGSYFMPKTADAAQLQWTQLTDGLGSATVTNTSTDSAYGASFVGFVTNDGWGPDSKWQGQAIKEGISVESGKDYKVSVDLTSSAQKKILIQTLCGSSDYTERNYTINTTKQHIDFNFHASASAVKVVIAFGSFYDPGTYDIYIEDMTVEEIAPPTPALEWTELSDGLGQATITDTCTESTFGATFTGFQTNTSWGGDSIWQGQAKKTNYAVENGKNYTVSLDASSTPGKKFRVQVLCNGTYTEDTYDVSSNTHIELPFTATGTSIQFIVAFGATSASEVGTYDIAISNLTIDKEEEPSTPEPTTPEPTTAGPGDWITVDSAHLNDTKYRLGTTTDFSQDGKWYLKTQDNSWENWEGAYKDAGDIEGFGFNNRVYHDAGGVFLWSSDLKSEFNLTAGTTYNMSVTLSYTGVEHAQHNFVFTEGGSSNMNLTRTVAAGTSTETYTGSVVPTANNDFVLRISWSSERYETAEVGQFEVTDVTFTEDTTWTTCTVDDDFHTIGAGGFQYKFRGQTTARYKTGTGTTINNPLDIEITNGINADHDFQTLSPVVQLTAGNKYRLTYNVENLGTAAAQDLGANVYAVAVNASNDADIASTSPVAVTHGNDVDIVLDFIAPASGSVYFKLNSSYTPATELVLTPSYADITPSGYTSVVGDGTFHTIGNNGFQYMFASGEYVKYKGGTSFNDPLDAWVTIPLGTDHDFQTKTPIASVSAGHYYKLTYNVNNIGDKDTCDTAQIYAEVCNASNDASLATSWDNKIKVNAGDDADIELEFMAPSSGQVYVKLNSSYTWSTELVLTPELVDLSPDFSACTTDDWTFAGSNDTGWQYFVASAGSAYKGGTNMGDDLVVNYNAYVDNRDHSLMARSPITQVDSAKTYTGSISIKNGSSTALAANNVSVSVHWYNAQTGDDGAIEGTVQSGAIAAGATGTFNFSYTAPDSGYIFYEASTSYTPEKSQYTFSATHTPPADGRYDVAAYKSGSTATYPTESGKIFAGWYDDTSYTQVHSGNTGLAYAKFIDEKVLDCKFQKKNDNTAVRFVSTIDNCLDYSSVGFKFTGDYGAKHIDTEKSCTKVYKNINADGQTLTPSTAFGNDDSAYFFTYSVRNMDGTTSSTWTATPFYVTPDGTKVYGTTKDYSM